MRPLPISLQARMIIRAFAARLVNKTDMNRLPFSEGKNTLRVPISLLGPNQNEGFSTPTLKSSMDTFIEGLSATGVPGLSQAAGAVGIIWGGCKIVKAEYLLLGYTYRTYPLPHPTDWVRTGLSGIKSIALGMSTFFPPVGVPANAASAILSAFNASLYLFVEPLTRASEKDIPELMARLCENPNDDRLRILLGSIGTAIVPAIKAILEDEIGSVDFRRALQNVLSFELRLKRGEPRP